MSVGQVGVAQSASQSADHAVDAGAVAARSAEAVYALIPAVLLVALSFRAGGYFPSATAVAAGLLAVALGLRVALSDRPFAGFSAPYAMGAALLGLLALWTLLSGTWSHAPARAMIEYDRALLYALVFILLGAWGRTPLRLRWIVRAIAAAVFVVCLCSLVTRLLPDVWTTAPEVAKERLSYPLTYWNNLGLLAVVGLLLSFALTSDDREHPVGRVLAAAALPVLATALFLTFSRGAIAAGAVGIVALVVVGRPRALWTALLAVVPPVAVATIAAYGADLLASDRPTTAAATAQGHAVAVVIVICTILAALARRAILRLDPRWASPPIPAALRPSRTTWAAGLAVIVVMAVVAGLPGAVSDRYHSFVDGDSGDAVSADNRARLTTSRDNGRLRHWRAALEQLSQEPLAGEGAGTYELQWSRLGQWSQGADEGTGMSRRAAHSLYVETLGELGIIGLLLVVAAVVLVLGGFLARARGPDRVVGAGLFAAGLAWALHAGIDWGWEMPAVTLWFFAAGGVALAAVPAAVPAVPRRWGMRPAMRIAVGLGCAVLLLVPARVRLSDGALQDSVQAFARGDCATASSRARRSRAVLSARPEPYLILGYCDVRAGRRRAAVRAMQQAIHHDPENWEGYYGLALARASAGLDPRPAARMAGRLRPWDPLPAQALRLFDSEDPSKWRSRAPTARLPSD